MNIKVDVYFRNEKNGSYHIFHEELTEKDIALFFKEKLKDNLPMWMGEEWKFHSTEIDKIQM